jgi:hypothetical protein
MREHLETRYEVVFDDPATGTVFRLTRPRRADLSARVEQLERALSERGALRSGGQHAEVWAAAMADPVTAALDLVQREADERGAALTARFDELDRVSAALDRRLQVTLAWGGTTGESVPAELSRLRAALAEQVERSLRLEMLLAAQAQDLAAVRVSIRRLTGHQNGSGRSPKQKEGATTWH